jgi:hypothetical protein
MRLMQRVGLAAAIASAAAFGVVAAAAAEQHAGQHHAPATKSLQEHPIGVEDPRLHAFYDMLVEARARGADKVDAALEKKVREMARNYPAGHGLDAKSWEDHVVDMAGQMLAIGKTDPKVFQSYENFVVGLRGPQ